MNLVTVHVNYIRIYRYLHTNVSTCVHGSPHFGQHSWLPPPSLPLLDDDEVVAEDEPLPPADGFLDPESSPDPALVCSKRVELNPLVTQRTGEQGADRRMDAFVTFKAADTLAVACEAERCWAKQIEPER